MQRPGIELVNLGMIDTPEKGMLAGHQFRQADVDVIFLYVTTYALSSTVLPVIRRARVPVIVLNLTPEPAINYTWFNTLNDRTKMTGEWLAYCSACPVPELASVFKRSNINFYQVTGMLHNDPEAWAEIDEWIDAAKVANIMAHNRLGVMGNYYGGMLDIYSNLTLHCATFGGHIEIVEVDQLSALRQEVTQTEIDDRVAYFLDIFDVQPDCTGEELQRAAQTSVALDRLVDELQLGSLAYYYKGTGNRDAGPRDAGPRDAGPRDAGPRDAGPRNAGPSLNADTMSSVILGNSLLTGRGVPVAGEYEVKNVQAMKIMDSFGVGGSFTEYYAMDFSDDVVLMGHDGPGHIAIAEGKTKVRPLYVYHGKVGSGLSVEMSVKHGPVTLLSVVETVDGKIQLLMAEGESVPGPILEIGNTNSRYRFPIGARRFVNDWNSHGPAHHCAVGVGHIGSKLRKLGQLLQIEVIKVC